MKSKMIWKLTACFAALLIVFSAVLGSVFLILFRSHTVAINKTSMEEKAVSIANTFASFQNGSFSMYGYGRGRSSGETASDANTSGGHNGSRHGQKTGSDAYYGMEGNTSEHESGGHGSMNGYNTYLRFLNELAMGEVWIVDKNLDLVTYGHEPVMSAGSDLPENAEQIVKRVFEGQVTYGEEFSGLMDAPYLTVGAPIRAEDGTVSGAVLLHSPVSGIDAAVRQGLSALFSGVFAALLFAGAAALFLSYHFTKPLRKINGAAIKLADGDYEATTGVVQQDEIGQVAKTVDLLADRLKKAEAEQAALDKMREDFVANVSHELRTPVAVLRGSLEVLRDGTVSEAGEVRDYYEQMLLESRHLERLVNDLLDLARLQDDRFQLDLDEVNLCDVVRDASRAARRATQERQLDLSVLCPENACTVTGDYMRIRQLLLIFLDNALKFANTGHPIEVSLTDQETTFTLSVANWGAVIPAEELPHLFDRFHKTSGPQNPSGTGLGLAIARQIADRHHAGILAVSENGRTCFSVILKK